MQRMPTRPKRNRDFWKTVYNLMDRFPSAFPTVVTVYPSTANRNWEDVATAGRESFLDIRTPPIDDTDDRYDLMVEQFIHGYAHVLDWDNRADVHPDVHPATWGVWYARLYAAWSGEP